MSFQTPITVRETLDRISSYDYILPAIQREFVWNPDQICQFFDSLMRHYPIGSFLFWTIPATELKHYAFYEFMRNYHERRSPHCPLVERDKLPHDRPVTAILDGQQRLTSLNIGLRGSLATRLPRKWWTSPDAFPEKRLYLNLMKKAPEDNAKGLLYDFRFLTEDQAQTRDTDFLWFPVPHVMEFQTVYDIIGYVTRAGLAANPENEFPAQTLARLHEMVNSDGAISYYSVEEGALDRVLDIFTRVNSGGTVLSYSDLLLSIATAKWKGDARKTIYAFVDEINANGQNFAFTKDMVLKAGLVLTDVGDVRFKVSNFNEQNMRRLEEYWDKIAEALRLGARLLASFGFSERTLVSDYVLIPVAYYLYTTGRDASYLTSNAQMEDRTRIRIWVLRSLLKAGVWGSGQDQLLTRLRLAIKTDASGRFPTEAIESEMARLGKSLKMGQEELDEILDLQYGKPRTFVALALLYPSLDFRAQIHVDHIFAQGVLKRTRLLGRGLSDETIQDYIELRDGMPNLQLLPGTVNIQKQDVMPLEWISQQYPGSTEKDEAARSNYLALHDMHGLPEDIVDFPDFYEERKRRMRARLETLLSSDS